MKLKFNLHEKYGKIIQNICKMTRIKENRYGKRKFSQDDGIRVIKERWKEIKHNQGHCEMIMMRSERKLAYHIKKSKCYR